MYKILFLILIVLSGCQNFDHMESAKISSNFSTLEIEQIVNAVDTLCNAEIKCWDVLVVAPHEANIIRLDNRSHDWEQDTLGKTTLHYNHKGDVIGALKIKLLSNEDIWCVALHELGHAMSLKNNHLLESGNVMSKYSNCDNGLTNKDIEFIKK